MEFLLLFKSIVMGIVEGITEFLPVSSTGHMVIVDKLIGFSGKYGFSENFKDLFIVVIQLGAILAIIVLYRKKILHSLKTLMPGGFGFKLWSGIVLAMVPAGIVAVIDKKFLTNPVTHQDFLSTYMMKPWPVALALVVGAVWMLFAEKRYRTNEAVAHLERVNYRQALAVGLFQCISMIWPGFSRSAATIIGGWVMGLSTPTAAEFSFFLAIPAMFGASGVDLVTLKIKLTGIEVASLIVGFVVAFIVALVVVKKFIDFIKHRPMKGFAIYRLIVGGLYLIFAAANVIK